MTTACGATRPPSPSRAWSRTWSGAGARPTATGCARSWRATRADQACEACGGFRLKPEALAVKIGGLHISEVARCRSLAGGDWFSTSLEDQPADPSSARSPQRILKEINERLRFLVDVGLDYLTLSRASAPCRAARASASASPRRSAPASPACSTCWTSPRSACISATTPAAGDPQAAARPRQHGHRGRARRGRDPLRRLSDRHGPRRRPCMAAARWWPAASPKTYHAGPASLTGQYLTGMRQIAVPPLRREGKRKGQSALKIVGAEENNLKSVTAEIPLGTFTCVTGVSGSGKSTLIIETLYKALARQLNKARAQSRQARGHRGPGVPRQDHRHRPVADRPHAALQPGDLYRRLHPDPRVVRRPAGGQRPRLQARPLLLQREGRALRGLPGRRRHQDRDALPARRLRHSATSARASATTVRPWRSSSRVSRSPTSST